VAQYYNEKDCDEVKKACCIFLLALLSTSASQAASFGNFDCVDNCEGHKAGYNWAEENGITDESGCYGNSSSFEEGCRTYLEDPYRGSDGDDDGNEIPD
jgi:hypothetical protein